MVRISEGAHSSDSAVTVVDSSPSLPSHFDALLPQAELILALCRSALADLRSNASLAARCSRLNVTAFTVPTTCAPGANWRMMRPLRRSQSPAWMWFLCELCTVWLTVMHSLFIRVCWIRAEFSGHRRDSGSVSPRCAHSGAALAYSSPIDNGGKTKTHDKPNRFSSAEDKARVLPTPRTQLGVELDESLIRRLRVYAAIPD